MIWLAGAFVAIVAYFGSGTVIALSVALLWDPKKGPYDAAPFLLLWPLTLVLAAADLVKDAFSTLCMSLQRLAMREPSKKSRRKSLFQRARI